ncbi:MAG: DUF5695 domain-containing protein [Sedimentisphaerales bacterium]|nr:DUF5695 domain-containing protein [Sedimentisphaerales bacterium]
MWIAICVCCIAPADSAGPDGFQVRFDSGAIVSLRHTGDLPEIDYVQQGRRLGDVVVRYRKVGQDWARISTGSLVDLAAFSTSQDGREHRAVYKTDDLTIEVRFALEDGRLSWAFTINNAAEGQLEIGDLALPLPMAAGRSGPGGPVILKHSFVSGHGSFLFWTSSDDQGPTLLLVPVGDTHLEYWDTGQAGGGQGYNVYIHSLAAGQQASQLGTRWRQPHTRAVLAPRGKAGDQRSYGFRFRWADGYDGVRQMLVEEGGVDVHVVSGMTIPNDLDARIALRTRWQIHSIEPEFPDATTVQSLGAKGPYRIYQVRFAKLGENRLTVRYGDNRHVYLEFFCTEPIETLIRKRAAFIARCQHRDPSKWYNGLISDWNMETQVLLGPDNYDRIPRNRIYTVTCDDPGLAKPAFLAAKNAVLPDQQDVDALDYYIKHFVWGGLQRTTEETYPYGIYGIPDWKTNRDSNDPGRNGRLHIWRVYDYPHMVLIYLSMYRIAKDHPHIATAMTPRQCLERAYGTANAMFTIPMQIERWSAYGTGFCNELVILDLIRELAGQGMEAQADTLRRHWDRKVRTFLLGKVDLFRSEYAFDSTGFESIHAIARYAMLRPEQYEPNLARAFMDRQMAANLFCRGCIEPAYYYLGSDYRGSGGNAYTLSYMSQMGGWAVLDYGLYFAKDPYPYLRLGYASYLSSWALMNTGTAESNYGYWYPGKANDGAAAGGFEPAPYGRTWLGQPHNRGAWYYACEIDLGFCGALRTAATILADDPIFGRICLGGQVREGPGGIEVVPKDGLRRRFHAILGKGRLCLLCQVGQFAPDRPIAIKEDLSEIEFSLVSPCKLPHAARLQVLDLPNGQYQLAGPGGLAKTFVIRGPEGCELQLTLGSGSVNTFTIKRSKG